MGVASYFQPNFFSAMRAGSIARGGIRQVGFWSWMIPACSVTSLSAVTLSTAAEGQAFLSQVFFSFHT